MSIGSQKIIEIIQYISFTGLVFSGLIALFLPGPRKKMVPLFMMFIFVTIISFVFYSGILLFITGFAAIFVFIIMYMLTAQLRINRKGILNSYGGSMEKAETADSAKKKVKVSTVLSIALPVLFFGYVGYLVYIDTSHHFEGIDSMTDISLVSLDQITEGLFSEYLPVILIFIAAVIAAVIWFTVILDFRKDRQKESRR